ncbi:uncharacterized protein [Periplaneta americana]|uniref:uncharacterized protein n=1 Tax=Periplaneta americana TaxID=6978 RepID=UPI0037E7D7C5
MTQALLGSRKRVRSGNCDEECCDFMPLSKRINNLHINNGNCFGHKHIKHSVTKQDGIYDEPNPDDWSCMGADRDCLEVNGNGLHCNQNYRNVNDSHVGVQSACSSSSSISHQQSVDSTGGSPELQSNNWLASQPLPHYNPALNASDNPYYYESNKLLFALYMERLHRSGNTLY